MTTSDTHAGAPRDQDRETLSALFDGELDPHGRLFATRRLSHDTAWQADCGRWQLIGDAMRRQAPIAAPGSFAAQVSGAVALERVQELSKAQAARAVEPRRVQGSMSAPRTLRSRWVGGALAASVALAAVLIARPFDSASSKAPVGGTVATRATPAAAAVPAGQDPLPGTTSPPEAAARVVASGTSLPATGATLPSASAPLRLRRVLASTGAGQSRSAVRPATRASARSEVVAAAPIILASSANPFALPTAGAIPARPWPRAVLGRQGDATFAAGYRREDDVRRSAPSFYPFGPAPRSDPPADTPAP